jgi:hypothetical protein
MLRCSGTFLQVSGALVNLSERGTWIRESDMSPNRTTEGADQGSAQHVVDDVTLAPNGLSLEQVARGVWR